jgi:hypothetical protein
MSAILFVHSFPVLLRQNSEFRIVHVPLIGGDKKFGIQCAIQHNEGKTFEPGFVVWTVQSMCREVYALNSKWIGLYVVQFGE